MITEYQTIKNFIFSRLQNKQEEKSVLDNEDIKKEIEATKLLLKAQKEVKKILFRDEMISLSENEFSRIEKELEIHFNVKMTEGVLIQGEEQQDRDTTWWTSIAKQEEELYYWERYKKYLKKSLPDEVVKTFDVDTDIVMNNIENPKKDTFSRYGMVVGHVQSGKTANYSSLICKAADSGYKFIVVIAGGINNLRNQTQQRIIDAFVCKDNNGNQTGAGIGNADLGRLPISLTTVERDFNKQDADRNSQGSNFENTNTPIILVIKKNVSTLRNVIKWLESQYKNKIEHHAMLMIDDESDYASINTNEEEDPTAINIKLRKLLSLFRKNCYVAYTATPYANIFIDHEAGHKEVGRDLFPKDFIYALDTPSNYFGARKVFIDSKDEFVIPVDDYLEDIPSDHKKDYKVRSLPTSMLEAIRSFILNVAVRKLRGQGNHHNSMLIHATRFTNVHKKISVLVENYVADTRIELNSYGMLKNAKVHSSLIKQLKETFELRFTKIEYDWNQVLKSVCEIIQSIVVREVHQNTSVPLEYRKDICTNAIVIGGTSLSRGFTLEGLSVSYFLRNTLFYDTLMQMARWFGYRTGYEDICKIYIPETLIDSFARIIEATDDLFYDFKLMAEAKKTPNDFGLAVKQHPDSFLQVTARNKQKNVREFVFNMKLDGQSKETSWLWNESNVKNNNLNILLKLIKDLNLNKKPKNVGNNYLWSEIEKEIIGIFLNSFKVYQNDPFGISSRMPIAFIKKYVTERNTKWDVSLYSGSGTKEVIEGIEFRRESRKVVVKNDYYEIKNRQISTGNAESISLNEAIRNGLGSNRKAIRKELKNPLLMLHILETDPDKRLAAFGVSFPGNVLSNSDTINLKINTVYFKNLLDEFETENKSDD